MKGWLVLFSALLCQLTLLTAQEDSPQENPQHSEVLSSVDPLVPAGFSTQNAASGASFTYPTALAIANDGRIFVTEKAGLVWVIQNGTKISTPFLDLTAEVLSNGDRGLTGIALDPNFSNNRYVYLSYTVDPDSNGTDDNPASFGRVSRFQANTSNQNIADRWTRTVLLGHWWGDGVPNPYSVHTINALRFGSDGTLLISSGDGGHQGIIDAGGNDPEAFRSGRLPQREDIGAFRAQDVRSLAGKILRIDPSNGNGLPSNPFYTGNPSDNQSKVWAYGLRNPWRFSVKPGTGSTNRSDGNPGEIYVADCGWWSYDELDVIRAGGGNNFGWPCFEGPINNTSYQPLSPSHHGCSTIGSAENPRTHTAPIAYWHHTDPQYSYPQGFTGACAIGAIFYTGTNYPSQFRNTCFVADVQDWIRVAEFSNGNVTAMKPFAANLGVAVDIAAHPSNGDLYYVSVYNGTVNRILYGASNDRPVAIGAASITQGRAPLVVGFAASGSYDPSGNPLSFRWSFGDGTFSSEVNPSHTYNSNGTYFPKLVVNSSSGLSDSIQFCILVGSYSPGADITAPATIIASRTTSKGSGNPDIEVIRDNIFPPRGAEDNFLQYETYDGTNQSWDWIGYQYNSNRSFSTIVFEEGKNSSFGGFFTSLNVEIRTGGQWSAVQNLSISPAYPGRNNNTNFETYIMTFTPKSGDAIRIIGPPGGNGTYISVGELRVYAPTNQAPQVTAIASRTSGMRSLQVHFSVVASSPSGDPLNFMWDFGDGTYSSETEPVHIYAIEGTYRAILRGMDSRGGVGYDTVTIRVYPNSAPAVWINTPANAAYVQVGTPVQFEANGSDPEQSASSLKFTWEIILHHNDHFHPGWYTTTGRTFTYSFEQHDVDGNIHYEAVVTATDSGMLASTQRITLYQNNPPRITNGASADTVAFEDFPYSFQLAATDADAGDALTYSLTTKPEWLSVNPTTGLMSGTPKSWHLGEATVVARVTDSRGAWGSISYRIQVRHTNHAPTAAQLIWPANNTIIQLFNNPVSISFGWKRSTDLDWQDPIRYRFSIRGPGLDTTVSNVQDTSVYVPVMRNMRPASTYLWTVNVSDGNVTTASPDTFALRTSSTITGIFNPGEIPAFYALEQNYPNPFNPSTIIRYALPQQSYVRLEVVNSLGQVVESLVNDEEPPGLHQVSWEPNVLSSGIYFCRLIAIRSDNFMERFTDTRKMLLVR